MKKITIESLKAQLMPGGFQFYAYNRWKQKWARREMYLAIKSGRLVRKAYCEVCETKEGAIVPKSAKGNRHPTKIVRINAHHFDYARPIDVVFLCDTCHVRVHAPLYLPATPALEDVE